jgi:hypothetical protein
VYKRQIVSVSSPDLEPLREYKPIMEVLSVEGFRKQLISRALGEVDYWRKKHAEIKELTPIFTSIEEFKKEWQRKKQ